MPEYYAIRIAGSLPPEALSGFDSLTVSQEPVQTVVRGPIDGQAVLIKLLARLELLGARVIEIHRRQDLPPPSGE